MSHRLTTKESEKALRQAGINPDPSTWSSEELLKAAVVLDEAASRKASR